MTGVSAAHRASVGETGALDLTCLAVWPSHGQLRVLGCLITLSGVESVLAVCACLCSARGGARGAPSVPTRTAVPSLPVCHAGAARPTACLAGVSVGSGASVHTAHPRKSLGIYMGAHPGRNGHPGRAHCCPSGPCTAHVQGGPWGTWCSCWTTTARPVGAAQACWPLGVQAFHSPMKSCRNL